MDLGQGLARVTKIRTLSESEKVALICGQQNKLNEIQERVEKLRCAHESGQCVLCADKDKTIQEQGDVIKELRARLYGKSSERRNRGNKPGGNKKPPPPSRVRLPSEQYPNAKIVEETIADPEPPKCTECQEPMTDSGLRESSERLEMIPMQIFITRMNRVRYHCKCCQSAPQTAALPARIAPNTSLNDSVLIEASIAKFYDLIPTERFSKMLRRLGVGIPDKLLFSAQYYLAKAFSPVYLMLKQEILASFVVHADESPHRMLEENEGKSLWYLWSFCNKTAVYFEIHNTRAGSVSIDFLKESKASVLMSDVYSGYIRTAREVNEYRQSAGIYLLISAHCNDHARRYFFYAKEHAEAQKVLDVYEKIYAIEDKVQGLIKNPTEPENSRQAIELRQTMDPLFEKIYDLCCEILLDNSPGSAIGQAANYFLKNVTGLTVFMTNLEIPISNAPAERSVRNPAVGRKTWYGTHSLKGVEAAAVHFSLFESCRLNQVNPREYYQHLAGLHRLSQKLITPFQYKQKISSKPPPGS
jgi:transposase